MNPKPLTDGFKVSPANPLRAEHAMLDRLLALYSPGWLPFGSELKVEKKKPGAAMLSSDREVQARCVAALVERLAPLEKRITEFRRLHGFDPNIHTEDGWEELRDPHSVLVEMLRVLLKRALPLPEPTLVALLEWLCSVHGLYQYWYPIPGPIQNLEQHLARNAPAPKLAKTIQKFARKIAKDIGEKDGHKFIARLDKLVDTGPTVPLQSGEAWSDAALANIASMKQPAQAAWSSLLSHAKSATGSSPSRGWQDQARVVVAQVGWSRFKSRLLTWLPLVNRPRTKPVTRWFRGVVPDPNDLIIAPHSDILRGLAWMAGLQEDADLARALTSLALSAYRKVPFKGPREVKVGNACVTALDMMPGMEGVGQLALLKAKVKFGTAQKVIEKALEATAKRVGLPREDLEEMAVPAYGLTDVGVCEETMGEFTARLTVAGDGSTELVWLKADAKPQSSVPSAVKAAHAEELKELQAAAKDIQRMLPAQRERLDGLFLAQKSWPLAVWRERYLDHPLVGVLTRRLIWEFTTDGNTTAGMWFENPVGRDSVEPTSERSEANAVSVSGKRTQKLAALAPAPPAITARRSLAPPESGTLVDLDLRPVPLDDSTVVRLWHPIGKDVDEVLAWRGWLESQQIQQPFKQAHREVYVLTDAERNTRTYSNRFAAHILRQHQFNALCAARGWKNKLRLMVDAEYPPASRLLPQWGLRAEFWIEGTGDNYGTDTAESGAFLRVATDQVRFYEVGSRNAEVGSEAAGPLPLDRVPPLVFSEIMRDVDLFVGVASVGNDPTWNDGGPEGRFRDYWQSYSFGDLSATAQTRKAILERLVPRLKIADRCSFADKFLVVRGQLRSYKIHLGSGNILMTPNDQYLCIVPKQSVAAGEERVFLPFEGDGLLSVILSKAFLLAADDRITDTTIVSQLKR